MPHWTRRVHPWLRLWRLLAHVYPSPESRLYRDGGDHRTARAVDLRPVGRSWCSPPCSSPGPLAGLIAEPSFDFGDGASTQRVLGVDFNGVHALSGFLLFGPAFYFALKPRWAVLYAIYVAVALIVTGIWAIFNQPGGHLHLPQQQRRRRLHLLPAPSSGVAASSSASIDASSSLGRRAGSLSQNTQARLLPRVLGGAPLTSLRLRKRRWYLLRAEPGRGSRRS